MALGRWGKAHRLGQVLTQVLGLGLLMMDGVGVGAGGGSQPLSQQGPPGQGPETGVEYPQGPAASTSTWVLAFGEEVGWPGVFQ